MSDVCLTLFGVVSDVLRRCYVSARIECSVPNLRLSYIIVDDLCCMLRSCYSHYI